MITAENAKNGIVHTFIAAVINSFDPNSKTGPAGYGTQAFVSTSSPFPYHVNFENAPTATAPAQRVDVTDQLDPNLDWSTFRWTGFGFGDNVIAIPANTQQYETTLPMTYHGVTFRVVVDLNLDPLTGKVHVSFQSLNADNLMAGLADCPGTLSLGPVNPFAELPPDVLTGFLPPEDGTGRGMGYFTYVVQPKANLPTGTQIRNVAVITFDQNAAIATNQVSETDPTQGVDPNKQALVTIDSGRPTGGVGPLPPTESSASFTVSWSGQDDANGSGIARYNVYVSDNGGPFALFQANTTATSATFTGLSGHSYGFYSLAIDNVGNTQATPSAAQATTTVQISGLPTTSLSVVSGSGTYGGTATLTATLLVGGSPLAGKGVSFKLNGGASLGTATTDANGVATLAGVSLSGINAGTFASAVTVVFLGDANESGSNGSGNLVVGQAQATLNLSSLVFIYDGSPHADTVVSTPPGLGGVSITYTLNSVVVASPTGVGVYTVVVTLNNPNYVASNVSGTLTINHATPVAGGDSYALDQGTALTVAAPGVLSNDTDVENNPLTAVLVTGPAHGTLSLSSNGGFTYTPDPSFSGVDTFTYSAKDSAPSSPATVTINVRFTGIPGIFVDNNDPGFSQTSGWSQYVGPGSYNNNVSYAFAGTGTTQTTWQVAGLGAGTYDVEVTWVADSSRASNAPYQIYEGNTLLQTVFLDQRQAPVGPIIGGVAFQSLVVVRLTGSGPLRVVLSNNADGIVIADALRVAPAVIPPAILDNGDAGFRQTSGWSQYVGPGSYNNNVSFAQPGDGSSQTTWQYAGIAAGTYDLQVTWSADPSRASNATYLIYEGNTLLRTVLLDQRSAPLGPIIGGVMFQSLGVVTLTGVGPLRVVLSNAADGIVIADALRVAPTLTLPAILDNGDQGFRQSGSWTQYVGPGSYSNNVAFTQAGDGSATTTWQFAGIAPGTYDLQVSWVPDSSRASNAPYQIYEGNTLLRTVYLDQRPAPVGPIVGGVAFQSIAAVTLTGSEPLRVVLSNDADGIVIADAIRVATVVVVDNGDQGFTQTGGWWQYVGPGSYNNNVSYAFAGTGTAQTTWQFANLAAGTYDIQVSWVADASRASNAPYQIFEGNTLLRTVLLDQRPAPLGPIVGGVMFQSLGTVTLTGSGPLRVVLSNNADGIVIADALRVAPVVTPPAILDNGDQGFRQTSGWSQYVGPGSYNNNVSFAQPGDGSTQTTWQFAGIVAGTYDLQVTWVPDPSRASNAPYQIYEGTTLLRTVFLDQRSVPLGPVFGGQMFQSLGLVTLTGVGPLRVVLSNAADGIVIADALRVAPAVTVPAILDNGNQGFRQSGSWWQYVGPGSYNNNVSYTPAGTGSAQTTWQFAGMAAGTYDIQVTWVPDSSRASNAPYQIYEGNTLLQTVLLDQRPAPVGPLIGGVAFQSLGLVTLTGAGPLRVVLSNNANGFVIADALRVVQASDLRAEDGPATGPAPAPLESQDVTAILDEAIERWQEAGVDPASVAALRAAPVWIADLSGDELGLADADGITIDRDAAGYGWFVDPTPGDDSEFAGGALPSPVGIDLLSVLEHELGHLLGLGHDDSDPDNVMAETLRPGVRREVRLF